MDSYLALFLALIVVVGLAMALAAYNNRADEPTPKPSRQQKNKKGEKKKAKDVVPDEKDKKKKKKKASQPVVTFTWDGTVENDDESMIELLRGTSEHLAKEAKDEIKKKVRAVTANVGQAVEKVTKGKGPKKDKDEEEFEYVLLKKRKKVDDKVKSKKKADKASKEVKEAVPTAIAAVEGEATVPTDASSTDKKGKSKFFYKKGVFHSLREAANAELRAKQQEEEEKAASRSGRKKEGSGTTEEHAEPAKDDRKDKPAKPKKANTEGAENAQVNENQAVGPRQPQKPRREPREPREPKEPREAPPPPPRPLGGSFETASLDDMLSAISTHYGPKPKQNFAKLPSIVLLRLFKMLTVRDIIALSRVNHFLSKQSRDEKVWRNFCEKDFGIKIPKNSNNKKKFKNIYRDEYLKSKKAPAK